MAMVKCKCIQNMMHIGQVVNKDEFVDVDEQDLPNLLEREFVVTVKSEIKKLEAVLEEEIPELKGVPSATKDKEEEEDEDEENEEDDEDEFSDPKPKMKPARKKTSRKRK